MCKCSQSTWIWSLQREFVNGKQFPALSESSPSGDEEKSGVLLEEWGAADCQHLPIPENNELIFLGTIHWISVALDIDLDT